MKRYYIVDAKCGIGNDGIACGPVESMVGAAVKIKDGDKQQWLTVIEYAGFPNYYLTEEDSFNRLLDIDVEDEKELDFAKEHQIEEFNGITLGSEYSDIFDSIDEDPDNPAVPLIRYLTALVSCPESEEEELIALAKGKYLDEVEVPASSYEEDYLEEVDVDLPEDLDTETLYRLRLSLEADIETPSIFNDLDGEELKGKKMKLQIAKERCTDDSDYEAWKQKFIADEFKKVAGKTFLTCKYMFAGIGQYEATIPEEEKESFVCWINGNGSAFYGGERKATEEEVKRYLALQAAPDME